MDPTTSNQAVQDGDHEAARLHALAALHLAGTPPEERFDRITRLCSQVFGVPVAAVTLLDRDRQWLKSGIGWDRTETTLDESFCRFTVRTPDTMIVEDATTDPRFVDNPLVTGDPTSASTPATRCAPPAASGSGRSACSTTAPAP